MGWWHHDTRDEHHAHPRYSGWQRSGRQKRVRRGRQKRVRPGSQGREDLPGLPDETRIQELPSEMSGIFLAYRVKDLGRQNRGPGGLAAEDPWHTPLMTRAFQKPEP